MTKHNLRLLVKYTIIEPRRVKKHGTIKDIKDRKRSVLGKDHNRVKNLDILSSKTENIS